ncbi:DUF6498-containing protein (plasmid) [Haloferax sp. S1W]|uniref:DUF6498-containing protein n=1 Tax=Haloferax sp. S1W TaxID=3377110 RepID=UPI0037C7625E
MTDHKYRRTLAATVLSNLVLLAGVFAFGWDPRLVLLLYWFEAGLAVAREATQSLFAALPPSEAYKPTGTRAPFPLKPLADVHGGVRLVRWLPAIYPRNIPYILLTLFPLVAFWPLGGLLLTGVLGPFVETFVPPATLALGALAVLVSQVFQLTDWLNSGEYETVAATGGGSKKYLILVFVLAFVAPFVVGSIEAAGVAQTGLGLVVVGSKSVYDYVELRHPGFIRSTVFTDETVGEESTVEVPDGEPIAVFSTDRRAEFVSSVFSGVLFSFFGPTLFVVLLGGLAGLLVGGGLFGTPTGPAIGAAIGVTGVVVSRVLAEFVVGWVVGAHLVYRVYPDAVVAYNTLTDEAQWLVPREEISDVSISNGPLATVLPEWYSALRIEKYGGESRKLAYFADVDSVAKLLET